MPNIDQFQSDLNKDQVPGDGHPPYFNTENQLRLIESLNYFETHYWRFRQTYFFENN